MKKKTLFSWFGVATLWLLFVLSGVLNAGVVDCKWYIGSGGVLEYAGSVAIGTNVSGGNLTTKATLISIHTFTPANWDEDGSTWTMGATGPLVHVTGNTTTVTATNTEAIVANTTYKVTITGTGSGGTATYTLGGVTGTTIAASGAIAITDWITASTTASMIITPASACTVSITSITIERALDGTGDVTVEGNLYARSQILADGTTSTSTKYPRYSFVGDPDTGMDNSYANSVSFFCGGAFCFNVNSSGLWAITNTGSIALGLNADLQLYRQAANHLMHRNAANVNTVSVANTYVGSDYEYQSFTGVTGTSFNWTAVTNGAGADNIDMVVTPAGAGKFSTGTAAIRGAVGITTHSATEAATSATMYGDTHRVTGAYTITLPDAVVGMNATFRATTAAVLTLDEDATDSFVLNGVAGTAGNKIASSGTAGEAVYVECTVANQWDVYPNGIFSDGGA